MSWQGMWVPETDPQSSCQRSLDPELQRFCDSRSIHFDHFNETHWRCLPTPLIRWRNSQWQSSVLWELQKCRSLWKNGHVRIHELFGRTWYSYHDHPWSMIYDVSWCFMMTYLWCFMRFMMIYDDKPSMFFRECFQEAWPNCSWYCRGQINKNILFKQPFSQLQTWDTSAILVTEFFLSRNFI